MRRVAYGLALLIFLLDQASKYWIVNGLQLESLQSVRLIPILSLTWVENRGVSMGLLTAGSEVGRWLLVALTAFIATVLAFWIRREKGQAELLALGLVLGGALGNIVDRIRLGYVVDFVHLHIGGWSFYVFNVADAAISIGVAILLFRALVSRSDQSHSGADKELS